MDNIKDIRANLGRRNEQEGENFTDLKYGHLDQNNFWLNTKTFERIKNAGELVRKAGLDPDAWVATHVEPNQWEVAIKTDDGVKVVPLYQIKAKFKRRYEEHYTVAMDSLTSRLGSVSLPKTKRPKGKGGLTWVIGLVDHHFGKLAWAPETGSDYDLKVAENLWRASIQMTKDEILRGRKVGNILLPVGNDFFHFDTREGSTTAGTPQHTDGRWAKVYETGTMALIHAVEELRQIAPVHVLWVPGNHEYLSSYWLCKVAEHSFKKDRRVTFDLTPDPIKTYSAHNCFWVFAHGQEPSYKALQEMVPVVYADEWVKGTACREVICGHTHQSKTTHFTGTWEQSGMLFRILPSLAGTDFWHHTHGYTNSRHATQSLIYGEHGHKYTYNTNVGELCSQD